MTLKYVSRAPDYAKFSFVLAGVFVALFGLSNPFSYAGNTFSQLGLFSIALGILLWGGERAQQDNQYMLTNLFWGWGISAFLAFALHMAFLMDVQGIAIDAPEWIDGPMVFGSLSVAPWWYFYIIVGFFGGITYLAVNRFTFGDTWTRSVVISGIGGICTAVVHWELSALGTDGDNWGWTTLWVDVMNYVLGLELEAGRFFIQTDFGAILFGFTLMYWMVFLLTGQVISKWVTQAPELESVPPGMNV